MIDAFFNLATELDIKYSRSLRESLNRLDKGEEALIKRLEKELETNLFSYRVMSGEISEKTNIKNPFVVNVGTNYYLIKYANGNYYDNSGNVQLNKYVGCRYFEIREVAKKRTPDEIVSEIVNLTPVWSILLLLLTPFTLITPLYTNIYNTRIVHSNALSTLIVVSLFFLAIYLFEFFAKKAIKARCMKANSQSAQLCERYILKFTPYFRGFSSINSVKTLEQYRKSIWDFIPTIATDTLSFIILFIALGVFLNWLVIYFALFYAVVFIVFYLYRTRLYQHLIEKESAAGDMLKLRISNANSKLNIPYINKYLLFKKYTNTFNTSQFHEDKITDFNFYWDEMTRMVSFFSLTTLFIISFIGISTQDLNPAYMIVLFIINSRLSGLMGQIATRASYLKASLFHIKQSMESLFDHEIVAETVDDVGVRLEDVKTIKVSSLNIKEGQHALLSNVNIKFKKGLIYGLRGAVGSGKSTFLRTLIGLNTDYKGKIEYDGVDAHVVDGSFFENQVSFLNAETGFFSGSLYDNFLFRSCTNNKQIEAILKECFGKRVFDYQSLYVDDIESIPMSTGQRKKLLFMMALLDKSSVYVFDEVLVNLSKSDIVKSLNLLRKYAEDSIIIMTSHNESILAACDLLYEIDHNSITEVTD